MKRRRMLVLTPRFPYPVIGGDRLRIYEICRKLAQDYDLTLLSFCDTREEFNLPPERDGVFSHVEKVYLPRWRSILNVLLALLTNTPLQIAYYKSGIYKKKLNELLVNHDLFLAHLIRTGDYLRNFNVPKILEMTDAISMNYQGINTLGIKRGFRSYVYKIETKRLIKYERSIIQDYPLVVLVSELDRQFLLGEAVENKNVVVCSNGVDLTRLPFELRINSKPIGVFIGNMTSLQNLDACLFFAKEVLPKIRERVDFHFRIVGRISDCDARGLEKYDGVEVLANVSNIASAVRDAKIGLSPVRIGAGVQNKVLEYMALGLPVVSSSLAIDGLQVKPNQNVMVANTPQDYVEVIVKLLEDPNLQKQLAYSAHEYVKKFHSWDSLLQPMLEKINLIK